MFPDEDFDLIDEQDPPPRTLAPRMTERDKLGARGFETMHDTLDWI